jgi:hypothetical protein
MCYKKLKVLIFILVFQACFLQAQNAQKISVKLVDESGADVKGAKVAAILKSGAYQDALRDAASGEYRCTPTEKCVKVFAGAVGYEASVAQFSGAAGVFAMTLKKSATKNSAIIPGAGELPGIDGTINPIIDTLKRTYIYARKIGLESRGRPAQQPLNFTIGKPIDAVSPTGRPFKIWVMDITQEVSIVEYTLPK